METTLERVEFVQRRIAERVDYAKELRVRAETADPETADDLSRQAAEVEALAFAQKTTLLTLFPQLDK